MTDPIADMLTRIRNALLVKKQAITLPYSKIKYSIAKILEEENLISQVEIIDFSKNKNPEQKSSPFKQIKIALKYDRRGQPAIKTLKRISKPGRRVYSPRNELRPVLEGFGLAILSTSQGLMTDRQARKKNVGGEVICHIW